MLSPSSVADYLSGAIILVGGGLLVAMVVWPKSRRARPLVYAASVVAAWHFGAWWVAVIVAFACGVVELGVLLWRLADRAEKRLGKRE